MVLTTITPQQEEKIKSISKHLWYKVTRMTFAWQSEAQKVIKSKLAHYEATGNTRKAAIYRSKLSHVNYLIGKMRALLK